MATWICFECGRTFDETEIETRRTYSHSDYYGYDGTYWEDDSLCPYCGSDAIDKCKTCEVCKCDVNPDTVEYVGDFSVCEDCRESLHSIVKATVMDILGEFNELDDEIQAKDLLLGVLEHY